MCRNARRASRKSRTITAIIPPSGLLTLAPSRKPPGNAPVEIINFDERRMVEGGTIRAWGELAYLEPLTEKQVDDYELHPAPGNPDRDQGPPVHYRQAPSLARRQSRQGTGKAKHHKSHEDR